MANQTSSLVLKQTNINLTNMLEKEKDALPKGFNSLRFKQNVLTVLNDTDISNMRGQEFNLGFDFWSKVVYNIHCEDEK